MSYDACVIGAGPGGYVAAVRLSQNGLKTVIIDRETELGGTCLRVGCIPSKTLLASTHVFYLIQKKLSDHQISVKEPILDFDALSKKKETVVKGLTSSVRGLLEKHKVDILTGEASFTGQHEISVSHEGQVSAVTAKKIIIATGSKAVTLPFLPFDETTVLSSTGVLALQKPPQSLIVVGAGVIGVELASVFSRLGTAVTLIEMFDRPIPTFDRDLSNALLQSLKKQGLVFHLSSKVKDARPLKDKVDLTVDVKGEETIISGEKVLVSIGRKPNTDFLNLEKAGVTLTQEGYIAVDACLRTKNPDIYAIGDVVNGPMLAHKASEEGMAVADFLAGIASSIEYLAIPNIVYTSPEVASVGMTEEEIKELNIPYTKGIAYMRGNPRARASSATEGLVKVLAHKGTERLLGVHIIAEVASEMIGEAVLALDLHESAGTLARISHGHPTLSEAIKEAALAAIGKPLHG